MTDHATSPAFKRTFFRAYKWWLVGLAATLAIIAASILIVLPITRWERYEVMQNFAAVGRGPKAPMGLAADKEGNIYGSTSTGGPGRWGTIFELIRPPRREAPWEMHVLSDVNATTIGDAPFWSMIGQDHGLYGATGDGGDKGGGTLYRFEFSDRGWGKPIPLYHFAVRRSPIDTLSELTSDSHGFFYGTTAGSGNKNGGTVFKLSPGEEGWTITIIHRFSGDDDGAYPVGGLTIDGAGAIYGSTSGGGPDGMGTVFKLTPKEQGWEEAVIHTFRQSGSAGCYGGCMPMAGLTLGPDGTLYGTTGGGGEFGGGVVFSLTPSKSGEWSEHVLYHFKREVGDGQVPNSRLVLGKFGALYGTTKSGGDKPDTNGFGTVFKLVPTVIGWREVVLHCFAGTSDGGVPSGKLIRDTFGNIFGTTEGGARSGVPNDGTIFEIAAEGFLRG